MLSAQPAEDRVTSPLGPGAVVGIKSPGVGHQRGSAPALHVEVLTSADAFDLLEHEWDELLEDSLQQVYFLRFAWCRVWWRCFATADSELRVVVCRDPRGRLMGLAPLYWRRRKVLWLVPSRELLFLGTGTDIRAGEYLNIVARRGFESAVAQSLAGAVRQRTDWDQLRLDAVPADSSLFMEFAAGLSDAPPIVAASDPSWFIDTQQGWDRYKRSLGRSMRRNAEYYGRRLFKRYSCKFARVQSETQFTAAFDALVRLHVARWRAKGEVGTLSSPSFERFLRRVTLEGLAAGTTRLWTLSIDGRIEAAMVGFLDGGVLHYFQGGFNPEFCRDDLGTAMLAMCIRDCCDDERVRVFDFMGGGTAYKSMWARQSRDTISAEVRRPGVRGFAFAAARTMAVASTRLYRSLTPQGLRAKRRQWLKVRRFRKHVDRPNRFLTLIAATQAWSPLVCELQCLC